MAQESVRREPENHPVEGFLRPIGDPPPGIAVRLLVNAGRLTITGDAIGVLGTWELSDLEAEASDDGAVVLIEGESLAATFDDPVLQEALIGPAPPSVRPLWVRTLPMATGLIIALTIWALAV